MFIYRRNVQHLKTGKKRKKFEWRFVYICTREISEETEREKKKERNESHCRLKLNDSFVQVRSAVIFFFFFITWP